MCIRDSRDTAFARTGCTPNPVHIYLWHVWQLEVHHMGNAVHINAARSNSGGTKYRNITRFKLRERTLALALALICLLYTSDAADDLLCVDLGCRRLIKKKK
eukprot:TRINITY_DN18417_c0_g1_i1.p1 TRINITY_DN18417_c0_g1~~TRINITY_DN18417_c0_g1_i1.p1  ORF type:complete len:102 (-),score=20.77 TRINITY_DN18417_c0_g1_i1:54-359(-)